MDTSMFGPDIESRGFHPLGNGIANGHITFNGEQPLDVPVVIVGGGPAGLLQAYLLSKLGVKSTVIERYPKRLGAPKAHALSPRSLEICRQFGLDVSRIRQLGTKRVDAYWVNFLTNLTGERVGVLPYERMDINVLDETPEMIHNIPQPLFEQFITDNLADDPNVDIRRGVSFISLEQNFDCVTTMVEERASGKKFTVRSRHLIACDGARSKVRSFLGIESEGEDSYETMMTIHFNANLRPLVGERVGMLHWIMDPLAAGFIIAYDLSGNAVLISNFDADRYPVSTWNEDLCTKVLCSAIGKEVKCTIHSYRPWLLSRKVAKSYRAGNVFLAGDAAHSFPPTGGLGLNSGLADVHNLAYKIAAVHHCWGSDELLDSYGADRQHVAEVNSRQSVKNGKKIFGLLKTLGMANISDLAEARANLYATIHDLKKKAVIEEGIEEQREHFDNLELHIGYIYGSQEMPPNASKYRKQYVSGARLPHAWISVIDHSVVQNLPTIDVSYVSEFNVSDVAIRNYSTLDLCAINAFTFILGPPGAPDLWQGIVDRVREHYSHTSNCKFNVYRLGVDFDIVPTIAGQQWVQDAGLIGSGGSGGLLVRPDQHILLPLTANMNFGEIINALTTHLGK